LERKCRFLFGAGILVLMTASFYWYGRRTETLVYEQNRLTGQLLVAPILQRQHWERDPGQMSEFKPVIEELFGALKPEAYKAKILKFGTKDREHIPSDEWEWEILERMRRGEDEASRPIPGQGSAAAEYQYVGAVRATQNCIHCHTHATRSLADGRVVPTQVGDLLGAVSVTLPLDKAEAQIHVNRALLLSTAIVTAVLAMVASFIIVRYVIVKPVKHLKDVSDAITSGDLNLRSDIRTGDEFEELSHAFNRMLRSLVSMQDELRRVNEDLDRKLDELAQANMSLVEMNRIKSDFLATMSHELRTPLNSILGFSDVLLSHPALADKQKRYVTNIQSSGKMLLAMINDILDLAKIESGKVELHAEEFSIRDICETLLNMARPMAEKKNIDLDLRIDEPMEALKQDARKIQQILYNLLSNAIKFTPEGGRVVVSAESKDDELVLTVADTGVGIAAEDQERIFEKFRQGGTFGPGTDAMTREYPGTGLGLSIVRELSRLLGGEVSVASELGQGSTFTVRVPRVLAEQPRLDVSLGNEAIELGHEERVEVRMIAAAREGAE